MTVQREMWSPWVVLVLVSLGIGSLMDAASWASTAWGTASTDKYYTSVGLWRVCNTTRVQPGDSTVAAEYCVFPTELNHDWFPKALVMEIMAGFCSAGIFICLFVFLFSLRLDWMRSRFVLVALIAQALLAGLFNFIGLLTIGLNLGDLNTSPGYSVALEAIGVICFFSGCLFGIMELQGCCLRRQIQTAVPGSVVKGMSRPI